LSCAFIASQQGRSSIPGGYRVDGVATPPRVLRRRGRTGDVVAAVRSVTGKDPKTVLARIVSSYW
jgi:hypothetical protein